MSGLLVKEFSVLKRYGRQYVILFIFFAAFSFYLKSPTYMQSMLTMVLAMLTFTGMTYDHMAGWDKYVLTMPVERKTVVLSKYITTLLWAVIALVIGGVSGVVLSQVPAVKGEGLPEILAVSAALFCMALFIYGIMLPLIFKFGVERARSFMFIVILIPVAAVIGLSKIIPEQMIHSFLNNYALFLIIGIAVFCIALYMISYVISVKIYAKKEF